MLLNLTIFARYQILTFSMHHNHEMNLAWQFIASTNVSVFLTGKAGTGKTTFLRRLRELTPKRMVVLAPTGVAAINAQGQTIHSFFQLPFGPIVPGAEQTERKSYFRMGKEKKNIIRTLDLLVIDEISMVRCDLLDAIDLELRKYKDRHKPFGGVQLLLIGDLQQLAPVAKDEEWRLLSPHYDTPYFFSSKALRTIDYVTIELQHIYRQQDKAFIDILAKIRTNRIDPATVFALNARYIPNFQPSADEDWIRLTTHNNSAKAYNDNKLAAIHNEQWQFRAEIDKNFPETSYPADELLVLKKGAQVMFIKNDPSAAKAYYNGKIGVVLGLQMLDDDHGKMGISVYCKEDNSTIIVPQVTWENMKYEIDARTNEFIEVVDGTFKQYPLRLAWAITVHKSQGLTFDHAVLDINDSFTHGQVYVALSRCRTLEGMVLSRPLAISSVITDVSVNSFIDQALAAGQQAEASLPKMKYDYYLSLLNELFFFAPLMGDLRYLTRVVDEHLYGAYPDFLTKLKNAYPAMEQRVVAVAGKFQLQYVSMMQSSADFTNDKSIQQRIIAASEYFLKTLHEILDPVIEDSVLKIGNKTVSTQYNNALEAFTLSYKIKVGVFKRIVDDGGFSIKNYLSGKASAALDIVDVEKKKTRKQTNKTVILPDGTREEAPKKVKVDTKATTFALYKEGKSIKEIAAARSLTVGTVENHLAHFVSTGDININDVVSTQHQKFIEGVVRSFDKSYTLSDIKKQLPADYSYAEIKMVLAKIETD